MARRFENKGIANLGREQMGPKPKSISERFWKKVKKGSSIDSCWLWIGAQDGYGYGQLATGSMIDGSRRRERAHRIAYELTIGPIPDGLEVLHKCDNPPCCNPTHLFLGTQTQNIEDMKRKGRAKSLQGEAKSNAVLSDEIVCKLRILYEQGGISQRKAGRLLGLNENTAKAALSGKSWKHVGHKNSGHLIDGEEWRRLP